MVLDDTPWLHIVAFVGASLFISNVIAIILEKLRGRRIESKTAALAQLAQMDGHSNAVPVVVVTGE